MKTVLGQMAASLLDSLRDLTPIFLVIGVFQLLVLRQPLPDLLNLAWGMLLVLLGLSLFVQGLKLGLFPIGESLALSFAAKGSVSWLLVFAFALGFGTTVAEPALIAIAEETARVAATGGWIRATESARQEYANVLRYTVALSVGFAVGLGVLRILRGWPLQHLIILLTRSHNIQYAPVLSTFWNRAFQKVLAGVLAGDDMHCFTWHQSKHAKAPIGGAFRAFRDAYGITWICIFLGPVNTSSGIIRSWKSAKPNTNKLLIASRFSAVMCDSPTFRSSMPFCMSLNKAAHGGASPSILDLGTRSTPA